MIFFINYRNILQHLMYKKLHYIKMIMIMCSCDLKQFKWVISDLFYDIIMTGNLSISLTQYCILIIIQKSFVEAPCEKNTF